MSYEKLDFAEPGEKERAPSPGGSVSSQATAIAEPSERTQDAEEERTEPSALDLGESHHTASSILLTRELAYRPLGYSVKTWPVPQVIVLYKDRKIAMGRQAIMNIGHRVSCDGLRTSGLTTLASHSLAVAYLLTRPASRSLQ